MRILLWAGIIIGFTCNLVFAAGENVRYGTKKYWEWYNSTRKIQFPLATPTPTYVDPMSLNPSGAFATHRFPGTTEDNIILKLRGASAGEKWIWDIQNGTYNYKTYSAGDWIDGSGDTWYCVRMYDQVDDSRSLRRSFASNQPTFHFNSRNGEGVLKKQGSNLAMLSDSTNPPISTYIDVDLGYIFRTTYLDQDGNTHSAAQTYALSRLVRDENQYTGIYRGIRSGVGDHIYSYNWDGTDDYQGSAAYVLQTWYTLGWEHSGGNLYAWKDKTKYGAAVTGNTSSLAGKTGVWITHNTAAGNQYADLTVLIYYDSTLTTQNIEDIIDYCNAH